MTPDPKTIPTVSIPTARTGASTRPNVLGMQALCRSAPMLAVATISAYESPPASGKSRALMFIALDKLPNQGVKQAIIVVPERSIGGSFADEPLDASAAFGPTGSSSRNGTSATPRATDEPGWPGGR